MQISKDYNMYKKKMYKGGRDIHSNVAGGQGKQRFQRRLALEIGLQSSKLLISRARRKNASSRTITVSRDIIERSQGDFFT